MAYKKKLIVLLSIITLLALIYSISLIFSPERTGARSSLYVWLDSRYSARVNRIVINSSGDNRQLVKENGQWFISRNGKKYPARQARIEDFLGIFTQRASWPLRSSNAAYHSRLGLDAEAASRITIYSDNSTLLDILLAADENAEHDTYLRRYGQNEVRSGENLISVYVSGADSSWYNLRLIPESGDGISLDNVQRVSVYGENETQYFFRSNRMWTVSGIEVENPDQGSIDTYVRAILNTEGDNFTDSITDDDPALNHSRIVLEMSNGKVITIRLTEPDETGRRLANVSGLDYIYSLPSWAAQRLFKNASDFETK